VNSRDVTDEQWEGLAQVVPLRGRDAWPSAVDHRSYDHRAHDRRAYDGAETEARRRFVVLRVNVFADARDVAETLMAGVPVLLDLTNAETEVAKRVLDFSTGVVFGLASGMHRVDKNVFLLTPPDTEVTPSDTGAARPS
jgi:FtsZ-interacting cell division protein YlmF